MAIDKTKTCLFLIVWITVEAGFCGIQFAIVKMLFVLGLYWIIKKLYEWWLK